MNFPPVTSFIASMGLNRFTTTDGIWKKSNEDTARENLLEKTKKSFKNANDAIHIKCSTAPSGKNNTIKGTKKTL